MQNFFFCLCLAFASTAFGAEIIFDFGEYSTGSSPTNFQAALAGDGQPGGWNIVEDSVPSAFTPFSGGAPLVNQRGVLAQTGGDLTEEHFPMFGLPGRPLPQLSSSPPASRSSAASPSRWPALVFRYQNASNFYVLRASALGHNVRFYKVVDGVPLRAHWNGKSDIGAGGWHNLAVQCHGNEITCWLDDKLVMPPLQDNTFAVGKLGFWTKSDSVTYFSDATIDYTPRIPAAQVLVNDIMDKQPRILTLRIYTPGDGGHPKIIASNDAKEVGQPGEAAEQAAVTDGTVSFGKSAGVVAVTLPFRDRNGDPIAPCASG